MLVVGIVSIVRVQFAETEAELRQRLSDDDVNQLVAWSRQVALSRTPLSFEVLSRLAHSLKFIESVQVAAPLYRHAVAEAERKLCGIPPGDAAGRPIVDALWRFGRPLWDLRDWESSQKMYSIMMPWDPKEPLVARTAEYVHAEVLFVQGRHAEASIAFDAFASRASPYLPPDELAKVRWAQGLVRASLEHYADAIPVLTESIQYGEVDHLKPRYQLLIFANVRLSRYDDASVHYDALRALSSLTEAEQDHYARLIGSGAAAAK